MTRKAAISLVVLLTLVFTGVAHAGSTESSSFAPTAQTAKAKPKMYRCAGVQIDPIYEQHFGGRDGKVKYPYKTVYTEKQSWASPPGLMPMHDNSEHAHVAYCYPTGVITDGRWKKIDVAYTFFRLHNYKVDQASRSRVEGSDGKGFNTNSALLYAANAAQLQEIQKAMDISGTTEVPQRVFQTYSIAPTDANGLMEARGGIDISATNNKALFIDWRVDVRDYWSYNIRGLPTNPYPITSQYANRLRSDTLSKRLDTGALLHDYHYGGTCRFGLSYREFMRPWPNGKPFCARVTDGGSTAELEIDPNHHEHCMSGPFCIDGENHGIWYKDLGRNSTWPHAKCECAYELNVPIPTKKLPAGWHKLVFVSHDINANRSGWTDVWVRPIKVVKHKR